MTARIENKELSWPYIIIIFLAASAVYLNTLGNEFISDDKTQIARNIWLTDISYIPRLLFSTVWDFLPGEGDSNYYRPVKYLLYTLVYQFSGYEPWGYHVLKILFHSLTSVVIFLIGRELVAAYYLRAQALSVIKGGARAEDAATGGEYGTTVPFIAALLFALHPVNTESVAWIAAIPEVSFTLFSLLSILLFIKGRHILCALAFLTAALSKETAMAMPLLALAFDLLILRRPIWPPVQFIKRYLSFIAAAAVYVIMRTYTLGGEFLGLGDAGETLLTKGEYLLNVPLILGKYLRKLILPTDISFYNFMAFDPVYSLSEIKAVAGLVLFTILLIALLWMLIKKPEFFVAFMWIVIPLLPVFFIGWKSGSPVYESRYLYASTGGYTLFFALLYAQLARKAAIKGGATVNLLRGLLIIVVILFSVGTVMRNFDWQSEYTIWRSAAKTNPGSRAVRIDYGVALARRGELDKAMTEFEAAIRIDPESSGAYNNIGIIHAKRGDMRAALKNFRKAVELDPRNEDAVKNLKGVILLINSGAAGAARRPEGSRTE